MKWLYIGIIVFLLIIISYTGRTVYVYLNAAQLDFDAAYGWKQPLQLPSGYNIDYNMGFDGISRIETYSRFCAPDQTAKSEILNKSSWGDRKQATFDQNTGEVYEGIVDSRTFNLDGKKYLIGVRENFEKLLDYKTKIVVVDMNSKEETELKYDKQAKIEKNWIPFTHKGKLYFSYSIHPHHVVLRCDLSNGECKKVHETSTDLHFYAPHLRGTSNLVERADHFLGLAHFHVRSFINVVGLKYFHTFYKMEKTPPFNITVAKKYFSFPCSNDALCNVQFAMALELMEDGKMHIGYGEGDCKNNVSVLPIADIEKTFE